jgi:peptidoglycan/xylan/chitin deacetylase (PgdA/CDA1 family)
MKSLLYPARMLPWAAAALLATGTMIAAGGAPAAARSAAPTQAQAVPTGLGGRVWSVIPTHAKVVALTFDAGANADGVASILSTLSARHVAASFFLTGNFTKSFPAQAKAMAAAGRVGDHSVSHPDFTTQSDAQIRQQVLGAQQTIKSVTGADPAPWFRFPYGAYNAHIVSVVNSVGFVPVGWTVDTLGWKGTSGGITTAKIVSRVLASVQPGEIVLMHCGSNPDDHSTLDAAALPSVISQLQARGYQFVTLDALRGLGYHVLTSGGGVYSFGAPGYGGLPAGSTVKAVALAADRATGGYWILRSNGGVYTFHAPWYGSLNGRIPAGQRVTAIAASPAGGYLILTSGGGVYPFGAPAYGSAAGRLPAGVTAVGLATDPVTGGYWILKSNGGVESFNAPWYGSLNGRVPAGQAVTAIASE